MAAVTELNITSYGFTTPAGPATATTESPVGRLESCFVACGFTGTYVQGTGYSITNAQMAAAISAVKRDGGTIVIVDVMSAAFGLEGTTNAKVISGPVTYAAIGNAITGLLYGPDLATEHAGAVMGAFGSPVVFGVTFSSTYSV
jgi:hypothetical protein